MIKKSIKKISNSESGFTILLAALVASLVLTLGVSIFSIAQKQVILSSLGRSSQYAFYAADSGAECALYWDIRFNFFSTTTNGTIIPGCGGTSPLIFTPPTVPENQNIYTMEFEYEPNGYCAKVSVTKNLLEPSTVIHADGFSVACVDIDVSNRALQRSVELRY